MKKITLFLLLSLCTIFFAGAQQERTATAKSSIKSLQINSGNNRALTTIYDTSHASNQGAEITAAANGPATSMADAIVLAGTNRILQSVTVDVFNLTSTAPYDLTLRIFTDCTSNGAGNSSCGSGPGTLIAGSTVVQNVTPPGTLGTIYSVTFSVPNVDLSGEVDNTITVSLNASRSDVFWRIGENPVIGAQPVGEPATSVVERCGSVAANNGCARNFGVQNNFAMTLEADSPPPSGPISVCGTGNPQPIPVTGTGGAPCAGGPTTSPANVATVGIIGVAGGEYTLDSVQINLTHTFDGDLDITLISPMGTSLDLSSDNGSLGDNYTNTIFMDGAPNITTGTAPFTGTFQAEGGTFAATFAGQPINGNWTLSICDDAGGDSGTLLSYCINFSQIPIVIGNAPVISCPADIIANNSPGTCGAVVNFAGVAIDTEDGNISGDIIATPPSGSVFPVGDTTVTLSVTDSDGNTSTCDFNVTIIDNEAPVAVCQDLTVELDPITGNVTVNATDVDNGSTDNCPGGLTYMFGSPSTSASITTIFSSNNGGSNGGAVYYDITVGAQDITITNMETNTAVAGNFTMAVYTLVGTYVGNTTNPGAWTLAATGSGTGAGQDNPSALTLDNPITLTAGTTYGVALVMDATHNHRYSGTGSNPAPGSTSYNNSDLTLSLGSAGNVPFSGSAFTPRIWNGTLIYTTGSTPSSSLTFDCSMTGANSVTMTITDVAGNSSSCTATITVQDTTAPDIVCIGGFGSFSVTEDFEAATIPTGWTTDVQAGTQDWGFGSGDLPTGNDFPTNAAIFDDDAAGSGNTNFATLISPTYDLGSASNVMLGYDVAFQEFGDQTFTVEVFDGSAWQQVALYDANLVPNIQAASVDVSAFADGNAAFQVRYVYDDLGGWGWHGAIDNFSLTYDAPSGGGLDVFLDANGMATVDPNALLVSVNEACGYTVTAGGGGSTAGSLTSLFASGNNGSPGGAVYFDVTVGPNDIEVTDLDINTADPGAFTMDVYTLVGTYVGNEANAGAWGAPAATASGTGAGIDTPSNAVLASSITLTANTTYGMALVLDSTHSHYYTNGDGSNQNFSNADLSMALGAASNVPFTTPIFAPRVFNGTINYSVSSGPDLNFTCDDLGENLIEVTVTDDSGNASTCIAVINVIDNIAPVLVCQDATIELGPDGTAVVDPMALLATLPTTYEVMVIGSDNQSGTEGFTDFTVNITEAANVTFDWDYTSNDTPGFDSFGYLLNGTYTQLTDPLLGNQSGSAAVTVAPGDVFGFRSQTDDNVFGNNETVISNFLPGFDGQFDPANWTINLTNSDGDAFFVEIPGGPLSFDACGITILAVDVPEVSCADIGTPITVTVFASDASGNIAACTSVITVVDLLAPELTCPANQTVDPGPGNIFYILPDYFVTGEAIADDNCTDPVTITTQSPAPGTPLPDGVHTITFTATDEYGNTSTCSFELTVLTVLGVNQNSLDAGIALYPNPASNVVNLVNKTNISLEKMMIYDINGKLVNQIDLRSMQGQKTVDVSSLAAGVYVVQIIGDNASTVKRLIKE